MRSLRDRLNDMIREGRIGRTGGHPGQVAPDYPGLASATAVPTANRAYFARFVPARDIDATLLIFSVSAAGSADDEIDMGIYEPLDNNRLRRLYSVGASTGYGLTSTLQKRKTIPKFKFKAGKVYYLALSWGATVSGSIALSMTSTNSGTSAMFVVPGSAQNIPEIEQTFMNTAHPLPEVVVAGGSISSVPYIAVAES